MPPGLGPGAAGWLGVDRDPLVGRCSKRTRSGGVVQWNTVHRVIALWSGSLSLSLSARHILPHRNPEGRPGSSDRKDRKLSLRSQRRVVASGLWL